MKIKESKVDIRKPEIELLGHTVTNIENMKHKMKIASLSLYLVKLECKNNN